jgi:hypothetical protein
VISRADFGTYLCPQTAREGSSQVAGNVSHSVKHRHKSLILRRDEFIFGWSK